MMSARYRNKVCCRGEMEMSQPIRGRDSHIFFICPKTQTLVLDNDSLLPVKFPHIPFSVSEKSKM